MLIVYAHVLHRPTACLQPMFSCSAFKVTSRLRQCCRLTAAAAVTTAVAADATAAAVITFLEDDAMRLFSAPRTARSFAVAARHKMS